MSDDAPIEPSTANAQLLERLRAKLEREGEWRRQAIRTARAVALEDAARVAGPEAAQRIRALLAPVPSAKDV